MKKCVLQFGLVFGLVVSGISQGAALVDWDFVASEGWTENSVESLKNAGWQVNATADDDTRFYVSDIDGDGLLKLYDNVNPGYPEAWYNFGKVQQGSMEYHEGMLGVAGYGAEIRLRDGTTTLAYVRIQPSTSGTFHYGGGSADFSGDVWRKHRYYWEWTVNPDGTNGKVTFYYESTAIVTDVPFINNGVPDNIYMRVSWDSGTTKGLYLDDLKIVPEPATIGLMGLGIFGLLRHKKSSIAVPAE